MSHTMIRTLRCIVEVECEVTFDAFPGYNGGRWEPSEGPSVEVYDIKACAAAFVVRGDDVEIVEGEVDLEQEAMDYLRDRDEAAREDAADRARDR